MLIYSKIDNYVIMGVSTSGNVNETHVSSLEEQSDHKIVATFKSQFYFIFVFILAMAVSPKRSDMGDLPRSKKPDHFAALLIFTITSAIVIVVLSVIIFGFCWKMRKGKDKEGTLIGISWNSFLIFIITHQINAMITIRCEQICCKWDPICNFMFQLHLHCCVMNHLTYLSLNKTLVLFHHFSRKSAGFQAKCGILRKIVSVPVSFFLFPVFRQSKATEKCIVLRSDTVSIAHF